MELKNQTIFILGITKFDADIESTSFTTAKFLAQDNDVYYIDYPYTYKDYLLDWRTDRHKKRRRSFFSAESSLLSTGIERLKVLVLPPILPINFLKEDRFYRSLLSFNQNLIADRIKAVIASKKIVKYMFINSFNFHYPDIAARLNPCLSVYHCVDPLIIHYDRRHGLVSEDIIVRKSDLIVCTSKQLFIEKSLRNENTFFIPNAADLEHCSKALDKNLKIHSKLANIQGLIIGYFGNIERRMDFDILNSIAIRNPEVSFVFAGPVSYEYVPNSFMKLKNVHFIGRIPYQEMPSVLKGFNVALIPFKKDHVSSTIFPLKLFEYIGAGKPVVSTNFNDDLMDYTGDAVIYCKDADEFDAGIKYALTLSGQEDIDQRVHIASLNTWDVRLSEFSKLLSRYFYLKNPQEREELEMNTISRSNG